MRASSKKQICSLGVVLPFDLNLTVPPKILPVVFFNNKAGSELKSILDKHDLPLDFYDGGSMCLELIFIRRNYDGSEIYYLITTFTYDELLQFSKFIKDSKGGILL